MQSPISSPETAQPPQAVNPNAPVVLPSIADSNGKPPRPGFAEDFRRFFLRGLAALMPTLITLWLLIWVWNFLWDNIGRHIIQAMRYGWWKFAGNWPVPDRPAQYIYRELADDLLRTHIFGVLLAILLVYIVGVFVGNLLGRTAWRLAEIGVMKIPLIRAIYPAVKQVTDFLLSDRSGQFQGSKVVACQPHEKGIWSIGLITGSGIKSLSDATGEDMITVFVPSSPTAFSGYVLVVPRDSVIELPLKVEEAMRLLISGGVITPGTEPVQTAKSALAGFNLDGLRAAITGNPPSKAAIEIPRTNELKQIAPSSPEAANG